MQLSVQVPMKEATVLMAPATAEEISRIGGAVDAGVAQAAEWFVAATATHTRDDEHPGNALPGILVRTQPFHWASKDVDGLVPSRDGLGYVEADPASNPFSAFREPVTITEDGISDRRPPASVEAAAIRAVVTGGEHDRDLLRGVTRDEWIRAAVRSERFENDRDGGRSLTAVDRGRFMALDVGMQLQARAQIEHALQDRGGAAPPTPAMVSMGLGERLEGIIAQNVGSLERPDLEALSSGGVMSAKGADRIAWSLRHVHDLDLTEFDRKATRAIIPDRWIHGSRPVDYLTLRDMSKADARSSLVWRDEVMRREDEWGVAKGRGPVTGKPLAEEERNHRRKGGVRIASAVAGLVTGLGLSGQAKGLGATDTPNWPKGPATEDHVSAYHRLVGPRGR